MYAALARLSPLFERERAAQRAVVLATVVRTAGSTYAKAGTPMLIAQDGEYAGLLSGGCLEGDLREHARHVIDSGAAKLVSYDMRTPDDLIFGLGAGCEGAMDILLQRLSPANQWQPLARLLDNRRSQREESVAIVLRSTQPALPVGTTVLADGNAFAAMGGIEQTALTQPLAAAARAHQGNARFASDVIAGVDILLGGTQLPPRVLLLGGGPDARPVVELANFLGWQTTVFDHRPLYAQAERFPQAEHVLHGRPEKAAALATKAFQACVIMSHHLASDLSYLRVAAASKIPYIGLLGPPPRRERLLKDLGDAAASVRERLHAPVGLDIGAHSPESIALSIVTEIHAALGGRRFTPMAAREV